MPVFSWLLINLVFLLIVFLGFVLFVVFFVFLPTCLVNQFVNGRKEGLMFLLRHPIWAKEQ